MSIARYDLTEDCTTGKVDITPVPETMEGRYVSYEDYAALEARCAALAAENAGLKQAITTHSQSTHFCEVCGKDDPCSTDDVCYVLNETPATDAFLVEVRASTIEHAASERWGSGYIFNELNELAAQIRKGVQS